MPVASLFLLLPNHADGLEPTFPCTKATAFTEREINVELRTFFNVDGSGGTDEPALPATLAPLQIQHGSLGSPTPRLNHNEVPAPGGDLVRL